MKNAENINTFLNRKRRANRLPTRMYTSYLSFAFIFIISWEKEENSEE